jgi:hypothetical protein
MTTERPPSALFSAKAFKNKPDKHENGGRRSAASEKRTGEARAGE